MITNISEYLKSKGVKPTYQRIKILEYLVKNKNNPSVDTIYTYLKNEIPSLSRTSVYNTLALFKKKKINTSIKFENSFKTNLSHNSHFKCEKCNTVIDFNITQSKINLKELQGYEIKQTHIYFHGVCKNCKVN